MNNVKLEEVIYPYVNIALDGIPQENVSVNLKKLYEFIGENKNMGSPYKIGNAYRIIKERVNKRISRKVHKVSKRQIAMLIRPCKSLLDGPYVKIPYKVHRIFEAIFELVDEIQKEQNKPLPADIAIFVGQLRRECFYDIQCELYQSRIDYYASDLNMHLYSDLFAGNSVLSKKF